MRCIFKNKIVIAMLLVLVMLTSCTQKSEGNSSEESQEPIITGIELNIPDISTDVENNPEIKIYTLVDSYVMQSESYIEMWENNLKDNFGVNAKFEYIESKRGNMTATMANIEKVTGLDGFLFIPDSTIFAFIMDHKYSYISPITEYCDDLDLPSHFTEADKDIFTIGEDLWALSGYNISYTYRRVYKKEFLEGFPAETLNTIEGIINYIDFLSNAYENAYFSDYNVNYFFRDFMDIFMAYGLYPSMDYQIGYNPHTRQFQDIVLQPEFKEAFGIIQYIKEQKQIEKENTQPLDETSEAERNPVSHYSGGTVWEGYQAVDYLDELNTDKVVLTKPRCLPWVMLKNTSDKEIKLKEFIEKIWNNPKAQIAFNMGIEGYNYVIGSNGIPNFQFPEGTNRHAAGMVVGAVIQDNSSRLQTTLNNPEEEFESIPIESRYYLTKTIELYGGISGLYRINFREFVLNTLENQIPFDTALDIYKRNIEKNALGSVVDKLNQQLD